MSRGKLVKEEGFQNKSYGIYFKGEEKKALICYSQVIGTENQIFSLFPRRAFFCFKILRSLALGMWLAL